VAIIRMNQQKSVRLTNVHEDGLDVLLPTDAFLIGPSAMDKMTVVMEATSWFLGVQHVMTLENSVV
jgi:hypothetical protein